MVDCDRQTRAVARKGRPGRAKRLCASVTATLQYVLLVVDTPIHILDI